MTDPVYGFNARDTKRIARVVRAAEKGGGQTGNPPRGRTPYWPAPWDVGAGNEDVALAPAADTQVTADTDTWAPGDGTFSMKQYRYAWNTTTHLLVGFYRTVRYDAYGRVVAVSAETLYTVDTAEACT